MRGASFEARRAGRRSALDGLRRQEIRRLVVQPERAHEELRLDPMFDPLHKIRVDSDNKR